MSSRRRKKPPDLTTFSLPSIPCLPHNLPADLLSSSVYLLLQTFDLGQCFGLVCGSRRNLACLPLSSSVLFCSSLGRCSAFVSSQWVFRTQGILAMTPSIAFVDAFLAHFGSVGVALGSSKVAVTVADSAICRYETQLHPCIWFHLHLYPSIAKILALACFAADGILVDLSSRYASPLFRLLVFRSELQVCYIFLFPPFFRVFYFYDSYLKASILKPTLFQFGFRFSNVSFPSCWEVPMLGYYQDNTCWILSQICAVLLTIIRMDSSFNFASCILLGLLLDCSAAYCVQYEDGLADYFVVIIGDSIWMFFLLISSLVLLLIWFCVCVVKPLDFGFQSSQWANHVYLGLLLDVCSSNPFVQALSLRNSCVIFTEQHKLYSIIFWQLVCPYAQMLGNLCSSICWHLASLLIDWDEVLEQAIVLMLNGQTDQLRLMPEWLKPAVAYW